MNEKKPDERDGDPRPADEEEVAPEETSPWLPHPEPTDGGTGPLP
jgi:hypothetical protein